MRKEVTYYADDGTEFYNEEECLLYEREFAESFGSVIFINRQFKELTKLEDIEDEVAYMYIKDSSEAKALFQHLYQMISFEIPDCVYNDGDCLAATDEWFWINLTKRAEDYTYKISRIKEKLGE